MKKRILPAALIFAAMLTAYAKKNNSDPTVMEIDGTPVTMSEFEYLYNKNNSQQTSKQSRDEYADMFLVYKLKVADALKAGIDTTAAFRREYDGYRRELAAPYLTDVEMQEKLLQEAYVMLKENVDVSHIMMSHDNTPDGDAEIRQQLDSIRTEILAGRADFDEMARKYSVDPAVRIRQNGHMGWISGDGTYPYPFVSAAYSTEVGDISPVIDSGFGYHIVRTNGRRQAPGKVQVEHILKLTRGMSEQDALKQKHSIDSIYDVLKAGADFADVARRESQDPGSAANGGRLDWFGPGRMVPEFEQVSFELADGEISKPFATSYGYHIVHRLAHRGVEPFDEVKKELTNMLDNDERGAQPVKSYQKKLRKLYSETIDQKVFDDVLKEVGDNGGYDSVVIKKLSGDKRPFGTMSRGVITVGELIAVMPTIAKVSAESIKNVMLDSYNSLADMRVMELAVEDLPAQNADYRNILNEYRDGMLLFEISNRNVWDRASKDKQGLEAYFNANREKYKWSAPKFKGYVIFASSDSISNEAKKYLEENVVSQDSLVKTMRGRFGSKVKVEKVIAAKGENKIIDAIAFGGVKPEANGRWAWYFPYNGHVIDQPEEAADVRGAVSADYQNLLETEWVNKLRKEHKYKINRKLIKNMK